MRVTCGLCKLIVFCIIACCHFKPSLCSVHCARSLQILDSKQGEIASSAYRSWSYRFGSMYDCWLIEGPEDEPIVLSFSQFSVRCKKESVSLKSSAGGEPVTLCGSTLPPPVEFPGGNITVTHHFFPHLFPVSSFLLSYARDNGDCPATSYECPGGGRCLPGSWRCNGRVECVGDGEGLGADERGCDEGNEEEFSAPLSPPRGGGTSPRETHAATTTTPTTVTTMTTERRRQAADANREPTGEPDLWEPLGERTWEPPPPAPPRATPPPVEWPCGGLLHTFYGTFGPPAARGPPLSCVWTLDPQDARPLRLDLQQLELGPGDTLTVHDRQHGTGDVIKIITSASNSKPVQVESRTGLLSLTYSRRAGSEGRGFNATFRVGGYCPPWEGRCGGSSSSGGGGCFTQEQRCDGHWDCPETGADEEGCRGCGRGLFACGGAGQRSPAAPGRMAGRPVCYPDKERCNYQLYCADGSDERECTVCKPGTFHCDSERCVFESWRCDGQVDCKDGTDEFNCTVVLPRKVITAATVGSLVCGLLLVIAMGCTCKLYSLRTREYSMFAPISRQEAELIQQQAPPSYGQLIAQGIIPPVEDFPTENPNEASSLSLRGLLQLLRQDTAGSPRRRRRPRFIRRAVRRMRRWGLIPRTSSRPAQPSPGTGPQPSDPPPGGPQPGQPASAGASLAVEAVNQPVPQKLGLLTQAEQQALSSAPPPPPLPSLPAPPPPYAPPAPSPATPPVAVPPSSPSPSLASIFHTLGLSMSLFRASPSPSTNSMPLSVSPTFSSNSSSDDEVLLIPLSEDNTSEDDVPMLT